MKTQILKSTDRGQIQNAVFEGRTLFSNGMSSSMLPQSFGALYVFNDDVLYPKSHLGMHPHKNVEIITLMISGTESHRDTLGAREEYRAGDVQLISSGKGLQHEGGNVSDSENARHLQIWVAPRQLDLMPSVQVLKSGHGFDGLQEKLMVSPNGAQDSLTIQQDVWMYQINIPNHSPHSYQINNPGNGVLAYVLRGEVTINDIEVQKEDTVFISEAELFSIKSQSDSSEIILIETIL
ncbi:pirin family protein [Dyadobacter chenwenxiniae]|uniref:Pirin family protein n=1 Tax=Dyadobacter chenwenxiniae TaxID=2906456 RepID=A0A9X1TH45_9BACT|nr:pirin family protein [Dyadobacter chenwenxiniae]MCF0064737.1 pirin family protein [Dyadobacter chenwenxiniae]UON84209.1 pirin family protein [Dyadobacter chenwenxiniae]